MGAAPRRHEGDGGATLQGILFVQAEEEEEEEEAGRLVLPLFQRQWFACNAGFTGYDVPCVMFPSGVARPKMLRIMAGMFQKDSCSGMARLVLLVTVFLVLCFLPCLQARDAWHRGGYGPGGLFRHVQGLVCWYLTMSLALCSSWLSQAQDARHHGWHGPQDSYVEVHRCSSWTRFSTCPLCAMCGVMVQTVQYTVWRFRCCSSSRSSTLPFDAQWQFLMVQTSADRRGSPVRIWWSMSLLPDRADSHVVEKPLALPQLQLVEKSVAFYEPLVFGSHFIVFGVASGVLDYGFSGR